ncbi:MAG: hypothetical protein FWB75_07155, partial [Oscillospiraceae bacterium]|nr:hypothetical protein [Oscillospiraceae bacterium]
MRKDEKGEAFVEAAILFPIMIMIFAGLVLLSVYLPARGALQRATQYTATALATAAGDTWIFFDEGTLTHYWETDKDKLKNVYAEAFSGIGDIQAVGEKLVTEIEGRNLSSKAGNLSVMCAVSDKFIYREIVVKAEREILVPVNLGFIGFPRSVIITVASTAVVQDGDEFVRNTDMAVDFGKFITERFGLTDMAESIGSAGGRLKSIL